jgi:hypothetical protein
MVFHRFFKFDVRTEDGTDVSKRVEVVKDSTFMCLCIHLVL